MTLIVEDGTGRADAESYVSVADLDTYATKRGSVTPVISEEESEAALRRATAFIDAKYRGRFTGFRAKGRLQGLEWPRVAAYDATPAGNPAYPYYGSYGPQIIPSDEVPIEIINATCEAAVREIVEPGSLAPDLERGGGVKRLKAGSVEIEYSVSAALVTTFAAIDNALASLLQPASSLVARAVRG